MKRLLSNQKLFNFFFIFISTYFTLFNFNYWGVVALSIYIFKEFNKINFSNLNLYLKFYPPFFYILKYIFNTSEKFNIPHKNSVQINYYEKARFLDLQNFFLELVCNKNVELSYTFNFDNNYTISCPYENFWGPFSKVFKISSTEIYLFTLFFAAIALFFLIKFYLAAYSTGKFDKFLIFALYTSPPVNFLYDRMNLDLFILIFVIYMVKNLNKNLILNLVILSFTIQYKLHPLFLLFGLLIYFYLTKEIKKLKIVFVFLILNLSNILIYYQNVNFETAQPYLSYRSFGIYTDAIFISKFFTSKIQSYFLLMIILIILILVIGLKNNNSSFEFDKFNNLFSLWFIGIALYANYDYRIPILLVIFFNLYKLNIKLLNYSLLIFIFLSPFPIPSHYLIFINANIFSVSYIDLSFYILLSYLIIFNFVSISKEYKKL